MFDALSRTSIGILITALSVGGAIAVGGVTLSNKMQEAIGEHAVSNELLIRDAVSSYILKNSKAPASVDQLIADGFLSSGFTDNGDGAPYSFVIDKEKGTLIITTTISSPKIKDAFVHSNKNELNVNINGDTLSSTFILGMGVQERLIPIYYGATAPDASIFDRWYDTSGTLAVLRMFDAGTGTWKGAALSAAGGSHEKTIYSSVLALLKSGPPSADLEKRYAYNVTTNTIQEYSYYADRWIISGGGAVSVGGAGMANSVSVGSAGCPTGFIEVPNSAGIFTPTGITSSGPGWCVAKYEMVPANTAGWEYNSTVNSWKYTSDTSAAINPSPGQIMSKPVSYPIATLSHEEAEDACRNSLVDQSGTPIHGGHLVFWSLWEKIVYSIVTDRRNWSIGAIGLGGVAYGHADNIPASVLSTPSSDEEGCFDTGNFCHGTIRLVGESPQMRTFILGKSIIWDFSGNILEFMYETHNIIANTFLLDWATDYAAKSFMSPNNVLGLPLTNQNNSIGRIMLKWPTPAVYSTHFSDNTNPYSYYYGGSYNNGNAGLFAGWTSVNSKSTSRSSTAGFRCVVPKQ